MAEKISKVRPDPIVPNLAGVDGYFQIFVRGASPRGPPFTLSREPLRRLAPVAWLASLRSLASFSSALSPIGFYFGNSPFSLR